MHPSSSPICVIRPQNKTRPSEFESNKEYRPVGEFTFINLSEPNQRKDKDVRKAVRSKAMRAYSQMAKEKSPAKKIQAKSKETRRRASLVEAETDDNWSERQGSLLVEAEDLLQPGGQKRGPSGLKSASRSSRSPCGHANCGGSGCLLLVSKWRPKSRPQIMIGNGRTDPFNSFPVIGSGQYHAYALNHCTTSLSRRELSLQPTHCSFRHMC